MSIQLQQYNHQNSTQQPCSSIFIVDFKLLFDLEDSLLTSSLQTKTYQSLFQAFITCDSSMNFGMQALIQTFYVSSNWMLPVFVKIMQSFILMQNRKGTELGGGGGRGRGGERGEFLVPFFFIKVFFLANIGCCLIFQDQVFVLFN